jgi:hypothetical protein
MTITIKHLEGALAGKEQTFVEAVVFGRDREVAQVIYPPEYDIVGPTALRPCAPWWATTLSSYSASSMWRLMVRRSTTTRRSTQAAPPGSTAKMVHPSRSRSALLPQFDARQPLISVGACERLV